MPSSIDIDTELEIGDACVLSVAPSGKHGVVFEDNGETGYFYAIAVNHNNVQFKAIRLHQACRGSL